MQRRGNGESKWFLERIGQILTGGGRVDWIRFCPIKLSRRWTSRKPSRPWRRPTVTVQHDKSDVSCWTRSRIDQFQQLRTGLAKPKTNVNKQETRSICFIVRRRLVADKTNEPRPVLSVAVRFTFNDEESTGAFKRWLWSDDGLQPDHNSQGKGGLTRRRLATGHRLRVSKSCEFVSFSVSVRCVSSNEASV